MRWAGQDLRNQAADRRAGRAVRGGFDEQATIEQGGIEDRPLVRNEFRGLDAGEPLEGLGNALRRMGPDRAGAHAVDHDKGRLRVH